MEWNVWLELPSIYFFFSGTITWLEFEDRFERLFTFFLLIKKCITVFLNVIWHRIRLSIFIEGKFKTFFFFHFWLLSFFFLFNFFLFFTQGGAEGRRRTSFGKKGLVRFMQLVKLSKKWVLYNAIHTEVKIKQRTNIVCDFLKQWRTHKTDPWKTKYLF